MRTNVTFNEISNELYNIFSDDRQAAAYMADSFGPQYIGLCGWAGAMSPANRAAFVQTFGRDVTDRAETEARARVDEYRAAVAASAYHRHELEADTFAAYGTPEKSQLPEVGAFVWGRWSCLKGEGGPLGELEDLERMDSEGEENPRRLCEVVAVVDADPSEFLNRDFADGVARQFQELGGSRYEETDPRHLDGLPMSWELVFCVRCAGRWYMIDGQGYEYSRYFLMPEDFRQMYAPELATITAAREDEERRQKEEEQRQAEARRADYLARCARWAPLMEDVRPLMEAEKAAYGDREKSRKASAKLAAARRRNLVAMASALFPGVKFSAKKWDGWGGSYELTWTDGPTEEHLQEAADFDLFESGRDTFDGMTDCAGVAYSEFTDFASKYFGLFGEINFNRHESEEFRQSIRDRIREAVPGLSDDDRARIYDNGKQSAICGLFRDVKGVRLSHLCDNLERGGLRDAVAYIARCIDATPTQEEPTDPNGGGSPAPSYGDSEKSQLQDAPTVEGVEVVGYSEKALAVFGDTRALADELKAIGEKFNRALTYNGERRAGWIISRRKADELAALLGAPSDSPKGESCEADRAAAPALPEPPAAVVYDPAQPIESAEFVAVDAEGAPYGMPEKSQNQEADEWGRTAETQAINAALVVVPANVMRDFGFIADSGEIVTNPGRAALLHPSRGFVCMPDDDGTPYTPAGGADALAEILQAGGFLNFDGFRFVWPIEHDADSIRRVLAAYGNGEKSQVQDAMRAEAQREEVRDWYMYEYPTDEEGANIQAGATFADIMANPARVYDYIPSDSIIRERVFRETANRYGVEYSEIYSRWLDEEGTPSDSPKGESCDADGAAYGETEKSLSEVLEAHQRMKEKHPRGVILYEVGDYYAAAFTDADDVAKAVEVVNVENDPLGFPFVKFRTFWLSDVLPSILAAGLKVNIVGESRNAASIADAIKGAA